MKFWKCDSRDWKYRKLIILKEQVFSNVVVGFFFCFCFWFFWLVGWFGFLVIFLVGWLVGWCCFLKYSFFFGIFTNDFWSIRTGKAAPLHNTTNILDIDYIWIASANTKIYTFYLKEKCELLYFEQSSDMKYSFW